MEHRHQEQVKVITQAKFLLPTLSNSEKKAAKYLLDHPNEMASISLVDYAAESGSSQAAIIRLSQRMGFSGFAQMKNVLDEQLAAEDVEARDLLTSHVNDASDVADIAHIIADVFEVNLQILKETYELVDTAAYGRAIDALIGAGQVAFFGIGDALIPCAYARHKFRRIGYTCYADADADDQIIDAGNLGPGDVAVAISHSGKSRQIVAAMEIAREKGATTLCITKLDRSPLAKLCDVKLFTATSDRSIAKEIVARRVAEHAIIEALYLGVVRAREVEADGKLRESAQHLKSNKI